MRFLLAILFSLVTSSALAFGILGNSSQAFNLLQSGLGGSAAFGDANKIIVGTTGADGTFNGQPVAASDFFGQVVYTLDTGGFSVINGTIYNMGSLNGGSYPSLNTNLNAIFAAHPFTASNTLNIVGAVPSYLSSTLTGQKDPNSQAMTPPTFPTVQISVDGGMSWVNPSPQSSACLVAVRGLSAGSYATNLVVNSYVNPAIVGQTNDLTAQTVLVTPSADPRSVASLGSAQSIATATVPLWANSPAVNSVNLNGHALVMSGDWSWSTASGGVMTLAADSSSFLTLSPALSAGSKCVFQNITKAGTNLIFQITAVSVPTVQYETDLAANAWAALPSQSNWYIGGFYYVAAPSVSATNCFFRGSTAGTNSAPATMVIHAKVTADSFVFTNAAGYRFVLTVNTTTNGFVFTPTP